MGAAYDLDLVFGALASETRRALLAALRSGPRTVSELAEPHHMSLNAVSKHLKRLEAAGLVHRTIDGSYHRIRSEPEAMKAALVWMSHYVPFWSENLESLRSFLEDSNSEARAGSEAQP